MTLKEILVKLTDPRVILAVGFIWSIPAFINSFIVDVYSYSDLDWWGKISSFGIPVGLAWITILIIISIIRTIKMKLEKENDN